MVVISINKTSFALLIILGNWNFVGCATSAPDGSSPRDYSRKVFSSIGTSKLFSLHPSRSCLFCVIISSGAHLALPMIVAPEAIVNFFFGYRLKDKCSFTALWYHLLNICRVLWSAPMIRVPPKLLLSFLLRAMIFESYPDSLFFGDLTLVTSLRGSLSIWFD
jgi:hypothetical protein